MTKIDIIIMVIAMPFYLFLAPYCIKESYRNLKEACKIIKNANEKDHIVNIRVICLTKRSYTPQQTKTRLKSDGKEIVIAQHQHNTDIELMLYRYNIKTPYRLQGGSA